MHKRQLIFAFVSILFTASVLTAQSDWKARVAESMPLLGHRNWILIVDSAYPLQSSPGVETIETNASHLDVLQYVLGAVNNSIHVRPLIYMDSELPFVPDDDAPGASAYRSQIARILSDYKIESIPHEKVISHDRRDKQGIPCPRLQDNHDHPLLIGLHSSRLQILVRRRRKTDARPHALAPSPEVSSLNEAQGARERFVVRGEGEVKDLLPAI